MMLGQPWQRAYNAQVDWSKDALHFQSFMGKHTIGFVEQPKLTEKVQHMEKVVTSMPEKETHAIKEETTKVENTVSTRGQPVKATKKINHAWQYRQVWIPKSQLGQKQIWIKKDEASRYTQRESKLRKDTLFDPNRLYKEVWVPKQNLQEQKRQTYKWIPKRQISTNKHDRSTLKKPQISRQTKIIRNAPTKQIWVLKTTVEAQKGRKSIWIPKTASPSPTNGKKPKKQMQVKKPTTHPNHTKTRQLWVPKQLAQAQPTQRYIWLPIRDPPAESPTTRRNAVPQVLWKWQPKRIIRQCISETAVMQ